MLVPLSFRSLTSAYFMCSVVKFSNHSCAELFCKHMYINNLMTNFTMLITYACDQNWVHLSLFYFFFLGGPPPKNVDHVELIKMESIQVKSELGNNDKRTFPFPQNYVEHIFMNLTFTTLWQKYYRFTPWICIMDPAHPIPFVITKFMSLAAFYTQRSFRYILLVHRWKQMNVS